jgi:hypothetical protein
MKANDNILTDNIILPVPELHATSHEEMEIYARFMRHLRYVPNSRMEIKILSSLQYVADMMQISDSYVARILVDMGLRVPRAALPDDYLEHIDQALMRDEWDVGSASKSIRSLRDHWLRIGEDRLAGFRRYYPLLAEDIFTRV